MRSLSVLAILLSIYFNGFSQKFVALSHNGVSSFFTGNNPVTDAVAAAVSGDSIYIPGGGFSVGNLSIDKTLTIYGVGHQPDSTSATLRTELSGSILLLQGASNSHLEGFYLTGDLNFGTSPGNQFLENIIIKRLNLQTLRLSYDGSSISASTNIFVEENIIRNELHAGYVSGLLISKNWIGQGFRYASNTLFTTNILFGGYCG